MSGLNLDTLRSPKFRRLLKLLLIISIILILHCAGYFFIEEFEDKISLLSQRWGMALFLSALVLYAVLLSIPFLPGVEIGWVLMMVFGAQGVAMVYLTTLVGLSVSFLVGRRMPFHIIVSFLDWLNLKKARDFALTIEPLSPEEKLNILVRKAPTRIVPFLLRHRYLTIALAFNLPGNVLIGGGGGIGLLAGVSRLFSFPRYLGIVSLAISPLPLIILATLAIPSGN